MVKNLFELLSIRQNSILSGAVVLMVTVAASKILGLVRDRLLAHNFSPDAVAVFLAAFRIPDLMFQLLIFGAVSVAFIPVFTKSLKKGKEEAWDTAGRVVNIGLIIFAFFALFIGSRSMLKRWKNVLPCIYYSNSHIFHSKQDLDR